ncbi:MAG: GNAT family N-acetyltransferase [Burkholderiales bacterium]
MRLIRPDDGERLQRFTSRLSDRSRYQRFMQHLAELPPSLVARFTHLDYRRELALAALHEDQLIAVGRYAPNPDGTTAEFGLVVADAWQHQGLGRILLERLCGAARDAGYEALFGHMLADNREMIELAARLGFTPAGRDGAALAMVRRLK